MRFRGIIDALCVRSALDTALDTTFNTAFNTADDRTFNAAHNTACRRFVDSHGRKADAACRQADEAEAGNGADEGRHPRGQAM